MTTLLELHELSKQFEVHGGPFRQSATVHAVDRGNLQLSAGETLGLVGESGRGKSTLGRLALRLLEPSDGWIEFDGRNLLTVPSAAMRTLRRRMQIVHQNPHAAIDPRMRIGDVVAQPLVAHALASRREARRQALDLIERVGLRPDHADRFPHELSGGQLQRVAIARAISLEPDLLVLDEPTSSLDVSVQAQILRLLEDLRADRQMPNLFISHDLSVIRYISDNVAVMYLGRIVESGPVSDVFGTPRHHYTRALLDAAPEPDFSTWTGPSVLEGLVPSARAPPQGCHFDSRCPAATTMCATSPPPLESCDNRRFVAATTPSNRRHLRSSTQPPAPTTREPNDHLRIAALQSTFPHDGDRAPATIEKATINHATATNDRQVHRSQLALSGAAHFTTSPPNSSPCAHSGPGPADRAYATAGSKGRAVDRAGFDLGDRRRRRTIQHLRRHLTHRRDRRQVPQDVPMAPLRAGTVAGNEYCVFDVPDIGRIGLRICYDTWFPEVSRTLSWMGAE